MEERLLFAADTTLPLTPPLTDLSTSVPATDASAATVVEQSLSPALTTTAGNSTATGTPATDSTTSNSITTTTGSSTAMSVVTPVADPNLTVTTPTETSVPTETLAPTTNTVTATTPGRTDLYDLPASSTTPEVQVEVDWNGVAGATLGNLILTDASGTLIYQAPIDPTNGLHTAVLVPTTETGSSAIWLQVDLTIAPGFDGPADAGSYQLSLQWQMATTMAPIITGTSTPASVPTSTPTPPPTPTTTAVPVTSNDTPTPVPAPPPGLNVTRSLPPRVNGFDLNGLYPGNATPGGSAPSTASVPVPTGIGVTLSPGGTLTPAPEMARPSTEVGAHTTLGSVSLTPGGSSVTIPGDRANSAIVGPLPLGVATPDGGIFTRSRTETSPARLGTGQSLLTPGTVLMFSLHSEPNIEGVPADASRWPAGMSEDLWFDRIGLNGRGRRPADQTPEAASVLDPTSAGSAFLPPIAALALADRPDSTLPLTGARAVRGSQRGNSIAGTLVALAGSVVLVLKVSGPDLSRFFRA